MTDRAADDFTTIYENLQRIKKEQEEAQKNSEQQQPSQQQNNNAYDYGCGMRITNTDTMDMQLQLGEHPIGFVYDSLELDSDDNMIGTDSGITVKHVTDLETGWSVEIRTLTPISRVLP